MAENIENARHSLAHLLAAAITELYPEALPTIGPSIENGFYYDFDFSGGETVTADDLPRIEEHMREILKDWENFEKAELSEKDARDRFKDNPYKLELIDEIVKTGEPITVYTSGEFTDLCEGGHIENAKNIKPDSFKLTSIAGAYWRGDENNTMLTRIYGIAFNTKEELEEYEKKMEEAKERDHRKIGKEMDLFTFSDLVGPGLPLYTPKGTALIEALQKHIEKVCRGYGFEKVKNPHIAKMALFETSGHAQKFADELFTVTSAKGHEFALKPVQCPHHTQIYASQIRSYRDLPIRYMESDRQYRAEKSGEVGGLSRVYAITVEDGHVFCRVDQIKDEIRAMVNIIKEFYEPLELLEEYWVSLSVRDPEHPEKYIGSEEDWKTAESMLQEISDEMNLDAKRCEGEAALYGPKLDFMFKDAMGKEIQIPTVQLDFATPKRFELTYVNDKGEKVNPVMIHRAILGSYERLLVLLIERTGGKFPFWLAPVQIKVLPIGESHREYAQEVFQTLKEKEIRVELDETNESLGKRIYAAQQKERVPYIIVIGDNEVKNKTITLESRDDGKLGEMSLEELMKELYN